LLQFSTATHAAKKSIRNVVDAAATVPEHDMAPEVSFRVEVPRRFYCRIECDANRHIMM
jgi:hypothetical protein